jgi:5-(carboxyamino)imidazole ribonucleotide mutase
MSKKKLRASKAEVAIIMGSDSDWPTMQAAAEVLSDFGIAHKTQVISAHRTPKLMMKFASSAHKQGYKVIIAGAGGAAHLPGMVASATRLPVIGVPVLIGKMKGLDALLSIAQMPKGVPVATMAIENSFNAGLLAVRILALSEKKLSLKLEEFARGQTLKVKLANKKLVQKI